MLAPAMASLLPLPAGGAPATRSLRDDAAARQRAARSTIWWVLRVGACLCFVGHGAFGILGKEAWVPFFAVAGIGRETAYQLMPVVGTIDVVVGVLKLFRPRLAITAYLALWAVWTASLRPITGLPMWEALERAGNYGVPLALVVMVGLPSEWRDWRAWLAPAAPRAFTPDTRARLRRALQIATALLLVGHGALAIGGKPELVAHAALLAPAAAPTLAVAFGWLEVALAALVLWRPSVALCLAICGWKLATESLFLVAGAPVWEVVERGGSYAAPLALAVLVGARGRLASRARGSADVEGA